MVVVVVVVVYWWCTGGGGGGGGAGSGSGTMLVVEQNVYNIEQKMMKIGKLSHQFPTSGKYCARYKSTSRFGTAIQTSFNSLTMAVIIRCTHLSVLMVNGGKSSLRRVCQMHKIQKGSQVCKCIS